MAIAIRYDGIACGIVKCEDARCRRVQNDAPYVFHLGRHHGDEVLRRIGSCASYVTRTPGVSCSGMNDRA